MAKISGFVFILIGVLFSFMSFYLNGLQGTKSLTVFIYIGFAFIAYGVAKVVINFILRKDKRKSADRRLPEEDGSVPSAPNLDNLPNDGNRKKDLYGYIGYCRKCGTPMRGINIYCHRCGLKQPKSN
ncbi:DUF308 domain-containing protein [Candidatus Woesearchaeota archaeon]|nr:DUF308 domain-containing protein [Candidatus Woesearchaeota archaeon]